MAIKFLTTEEGCMTSKVQVLLLDDLDGGEAHGTVTFGLDGTAYEIDLSEGNAAQLRSVLQPYVDRARKTKAATATVKAVRRTAADRNEAAKIRAWAKERGIEINERGRIPGTIVDKYNAEQ